MKITLIPRAQPNPLVARIEGDILYLNGRALDLSRLADGDILPAEAINSDWLTGMLTRTDGVLQLGLILPHGPGAAPETCFPEPVEAGDGPVALPPYGPGAPTPDMAEGMIPVECSQLVSAQDHKRAQDAAQQAADVAAAKAYLRDTDWYVMRQAEAGTEIPGDVVEKRRAARNTASAT